jgi:CMP-N-acetylneuraminic acid synthetase
MNLFIPIKEKSQRVPQKNFRKLPDGESLWEHTIKKFDEFSIYIDTDSEEILEKSKQYNHVKAYERSSRLIGHDVSVCDLIRDCISRNHLGDSSSHLGQIHVTSPLLKSETLKNAFSYIKKYDSVVSCNKLQTRLWRKENYGYAPINHNPVKLEQTQDLPELYEENSAFYIFKCSNFFHTNLRIGSNPFFYPVSHPENIDIDTEEDWGITMNYITNENQTSSNDKSSR